MLPFFPISCTSNLKEAVLEETYLPTYIPTYLPAYLPAYLPIYLSTYLQGHPDTYRSENNIYILHTYICTYIHTYVRTYVRVYVCECVRACGHAFGRTCVHASMHAGFMFVFCVNKERGGRADQKKSWRKQFATRGSNILPSP